MCLIVTYLCAAAWCVWMTLKFSLATVFIVLLFFFISSELFFSLQLLLDMLASIIYPCACCSGEPTACWCATNTGFFFSWMECEREATGLPVPPWWPTASVSWGLWRCILALTATADSLQWDSVKDKGLAMPNNSLYFLGITTTGQCSAILWEVWRYLQNCRYFWSPVRVISTVQVLQL